MANRAIEYVYKIIDQYTSTMKKMSKGTNLFEKDMKKARDTAMKMGENISKSLKRIATIGFLALTAGITKFIYDSTKAWDRQAGAIRSVDATLKSTSGTVGRSLNQLTKQASELQSRTFFGDETILQNVTAQMLTFTNITETQFDRAQKAVLDVTAKLYGLNASGESTQAVTIQLSKALNDPIANLGALSRSGIQFSTQQKDMIKTLVKSGQLWKAQNIILTEIEKQYGGTADALTRTAQGLSLQNKNMIGDFMELVGKGIEPLRMKWLQMVNTFMRKIDTEKVTKWMSMAVEKIEIFIDKAIAGFKVAWSIFSAVYKAIKPFLPILAVLIASIWLVHKAYMAWLIIQWILNIALTANPIGLIIMAIGALIAAIALLIIYKKQVIIFLQKWWDKIKMLLLIFAPFLSMIVVIVDVIRLMAKYWDKIVEKFKGGDILESLKNIGKSIINNMLTPIILLLELIGKIPFMKKLTEGALEGINKLKTRLGIDIGEEKGVKTPIPQKTTQNVNVKTSVSVYKESGIKVEPFTKRGNLGYHMGPHYGM